MAIPERFQDIVAGGTAFAGLIGIPGGLAPGGDVPFLVGTWATGTYLIANKAGIHTEKNQWVGITTSSVAGIAAFMAGSKLAAFLIPGVGPLAAMGTNATLNALFTYRYLRNVAKAYDRYDPEEITAQLLLNGATLATGLLAVWTIPGDLKDIAEILTGNHSHMFDIFKSGGMSA